MYTLWPGSVDFNDEKHTPLFSRAKVVIGGSGLQVPWPCKSVSHKCLSSSSSLSGTILLYSVELAGSSFAAAVYECCQAYCDLHVCRRCFTSRGFGRHQCFVPTLLSSPDRCFSTFATA